MIKMLAELYTAWNEAEPDMGYDAKADERRAKQPVEEPPSPPWPSPLNDADSTRPRRPRRPTVRGFPAR